VRGAAARRSPSSKHVGELDRGGDLAGELDRGGDSTAL
jgi:hypothetical protein